MKTAVTLCFIAGLLTVVVCESQQVSSQEEGEYLISIVNGLEKGLTLDQVLDVIRDEELKPLRHNELAFAHAGCAAGPGYREELCQPRFSQMHLLDFFTSITPRECCTGEKTPNIKELTRIEYFRCPNPYHYNGAITLPPYWLPCTRIQTYTTINGYSCREPERETCCEGFTDTEKGCLSVDTLRKLVNVIQRVQCEHPVYRQSNRRSV